MNKSVIAEGQDIVAWLVLVLLYEQIDEQCICVCTCSQIKNNIELYSWRYILSRTVVRLEVRAADEGVAIVRQKLCLNFESFALMWSCICAES